MASGLDANSSTMRHRRCTALLLASTLAIIAANSASAGDYYSGILTNGIATGLIEVRRPHFQNMSDDHVTARFRCRGDACYSPWGDYFEDNTDLQSTGSFVFLQSPRGHKVYVTCSTDIQRALPARAPLFHPAIPQAAGLTPKPTRRA